MSYCSAVTVIKLFTAKSPFVKHDFCLKTRTRRMSSREMWTPAWVHDTSILASETFWLNRNDDIFDYPISGGDITGGMCFYVNLCCCPTSNMREELCTANFRLLAVSLRPFSILREFPQLLFLLVYIHHRAKSTTTINHIRTTLYKLEQLFPHSAKFILGDSWNASWFLKGFSQYLTCLTQIGKKLERCYGSVPNAYRSVGLYPLGSADHHTILLLPAYSMVIRRVKKVIRPSVDQGGHRWSPRLSGVYGLAQTPLSTWQLQWAGGCGLLLHQLLWNE